MSKQIRKTRNVITLDTSKISQSAQLRWQNEVNNFIDKLNDREKKLMRELVEIITRKPKKQESTCEVINFNKEKHA